MTRNSKRGRHSRRERMANRFLERGHATVREILTMSFGEWPIKGLELDPAVTHDQKIDFRLVKSDAFAGATFLGSTRIDINDKFEYFGAMKSTIYGRHSLVSIMGHEVTHTLQGRRKDYYTCYHAVAEFIKFARETDGLGYYKLTEREKDGLKANFHRSARQKIRKKYLNYYRRDMEIQARVHEVMAECYQHCGRLPATPNELWMAFSSFGVKPPTDIAKKLEKLPATSTAQDFKVENVPEFRTRKELQALLHLLSEPVQSRFWEKTLPVVYGDLIAIYGDRQGVRRFGFQPYKPPKPKDKIIPPMN